MKIIFFAIFERFCNRSPTCPQCRRNCQLGEGSRIFLDFAEDEFLATTSVRVSPIHGPPNPANQNHEETIKILLDHIDEDSWKTEEMDNQLAEFDARSEELSKTKSIMEEQSETSKTILTALDSILVENERLEQENYITKHENANLRKMNGDLGVQLQQLEEQIRVNDYNVRVLREQSEKVERESNAHQWSISLKDNKIRDLERINQSKVSEMNILCDQITELKLSYADQAEEIKNIFSMFQTMIKQNFGTKMLQRLKQPKKAIEIAQQESQNSDIRSVVPFCGSIEEWDFMLVPFIKKRLQPTQILIMKSN